MKNLIFCGLLAAGCCFSAASQSKLSGQAQLLLQRHNSEMAVSRAADNTEVMAFVTLLPGYTADILTAKGLEIVASTGAINIVSLPLARAEEIAAMPEVKAVEFGEQSGIMMDRARALSNVDVAHAGTHADMANTQYTGKGVLTGLYDTGLDPKHAAFQNADGTTRVKAIFKASGYATAKVEEYTTPEQIARFDTDTRYESHGTHVAGIMAGSRGVQGEYGAAGGGGTGDIPYYGVAYKSELVIGCGDFYDASIMAGVAKVVEFAKQQGKPAVVNLSLGGNSGSHDPKSTVSQFMDDLGKDAIICIAAGNEGESPMAIQKNFTGMGSSGKSLKTFITPEKPSLPVVYTAEFWGDNNESFDCSLVLYDKRTKEILAEKKIEKGTSSWSGSDNDVFASTFTSSSRASVSCGVDPVTERFYVIMNNSMQYAQGSSFVVFGINITGKKGRKCYAYINTAFNAAQQAYFTSEDVTGYTSGTPDGSINGFGCGYKMVSVGSYTSRTSCPYIGSGAYQGSGTVGAISSFSSYGQTGDGRQLPHVCAPGQQIVSAISQYWFEEMNMTKDRVCAYAENKGHKSAYYPMQGTSMATPFAAGVIALWLEAKPDATIDDIHDIIERSSKTDAQTSADFKRFGAGKIDAIEGLRVALGKVDIRETLKDNVDKNLMYTVSGRQIEVIVPGIDTFGVTLYNLQGASVLSAKASGEKATVDASALSSGIYLLTADTEGGKVTRKIVLN